MMLSDSQRHMLQTKGVVLGRVLLGLIFFVSGISMLMGGPAESFPAMAAAGAGLPAPVLMAWIAVLIKVIAGAMLIVGYRVGCAAGFLIIFTIAANLLAHMELSDPMQQTQFMKNLAIIGGLLYAAAFGAGKWS